MKTWNSADAARIAGISYRQLDYWTRSDRITPTIEAKGTGTPRRWTRSDIDNLISIRREREALRQA